MHRFDHKSGAWLFFIHFFLDKYFPKVYTILSACCYRTGDGGGQKSILTEEIAKACCSTAGLITVQSSLVGEPLLKWGSEYLKDKWLPLLASGEKIGAFALSEPNIGSNARDVQTNYEPKGDGFILNGRKKWISFGFFCN